nr:MAG TPA: hypothetical protein [Caudoviricetes sp.]
MQALLKSKKMNIALPPFSYKTIVRGETLKPLVNGDRNVTFVP